jgi:hypothetical protein
MWDVLYAFGVGIGFSIGVITGATLCAFTTRKGIKDERERWNERQDGIEGRLASTLVQTTRIADAVALFAEQGKIKINAK